MKTATKPTQDADGWGVAGARAAALGPGDVVMGEAEEEEDEQDPNAWDDEALDRISWPGYRRPAAAPTTPLFGSAAPTAGAEGPGSGSGFNTIFRSKAGLGPGGSDGTGFKFDTGDFGGFGWGQGSPQATMSTRATAKMEGSVGAPALPMFGGGPSTPMGAPARSPALLGGGFGALVAVAQRAQASRQVFKEAVLDRGGPCDIGFRTGGAQDMCNFRENLKAGKLPLPSDVTFEGVVKDYFFDCSPSEGEEGERPTDLFFPTYSLALAPDPLLAAEPASPTTGCMPVRSPAPDIFLSVGLDSGITDFRHPRLIMLVLLDVSGSMDCSFDYYYYDARTGARKVLSAEERKATKLDVAKEVLLGMMDKLGKDDSIAISLFNSRASTPKPLGPVRTARLAEIRAGVRALHTTGCTNLQAGVDEAVYQFWRYSSFRNADPVATESRLVILTDDQLNAGDFLTEGLMARVKANALDGIHTTFIGVGLDFNSSLVEEIGKVKGCNYYSVHSPGEFRSRLCDDFDCMVSPLVFDLALKVAPESLTGGWRILHAYGSPNPEETRLSEDGSIMKIHTLFPSLKTDEGIKGGVLLLRMQPPEAASKGAAPAPLALSVTYRDRAMVPYASNKTVPLPAGLLSGAAGPGMQLFQSSGVRKAVALARYMDALQSWLVDENKRDVPPDGPGLRFGTRATYFFSSEWERTSKALGVGPAARDAFRVLAPFMRAEAAAVGDADMNQEADILDRLVAAA